jgi:hypothetical protein
MSWKAGGNMIVVAKTNIQDTTEAKEDVPLFATLSVLVVNTDFKLSAS